MTITKPSKTQVADFIAKAPDGGAHEKPADLADEMTQITLRMSRSDLAKLDAAAGRLRLSRAALLKHAAFRFIKEN